MTRPDVADAMQDALRGADGQALTVLPIVDLDFDSDPVFAWGGIGDLVWNGQTYQGVGNLGEIGTIQSDIKGSIPSLELSLNHLDSSILAAARDQRYMGRRGRVWIGTFDDASELIADPALFFAGEISSMRIADGPDPAINIVIDSRMALLRQNRPTYRTREDHNRLLKKANPGASEDRFFEFVPALLSKTVYWGLKSPSNSPSGAGGGTGGGGGGGGGGYFGGPGSISDAPFGPLS